MTIKNMSVPEAMERLGAYEYAYIRRLSAVTLGRRPADFDTEELLEARFFGENGELRLFRKDGELKAVELRETEEDDTLEAEYEIENEHFGARVTVLRILDYDEDGQAYVSAGRLLDWKEGR